MKAGPSISGNIFLTQKKVKSAFCVNRQSLLEIQVRFKLRGVLHLRGWKINPEMTHEFGLYLQP